MRTNNDPYLKALRSYGRPPIFKNPRELAIKIQEYFKYCIQDTSWNQQNWVGKDGKEVVKNIKTPFTMQGLRAFIPLTREAWKDYKNKGDNIEELSPEDSKIAKEFSLLCAYTEEIVARQQLEGAATGMYSHHLIGKLQGLTEKTDITSLGEKINSLGGVKVELPEGINVNQIEDAQIVEDTPLTIKKNIA